MENKTLLNIWKSTLNINEPYLITTCFNEIVAHYAGKNRHYHNLSHVGDLFQQIEKSGLSEKDYTILIHAALFHDVIYQPGSQSNEQESATFSTNKLSSLGLEKQVIETVHTIILATSNHASNSPLVQLFLDMDLSILGASPQRYQQYKAQIRKEHQKVPSFLYRIGRKRFIKTMLSKQAIFSTGRYRADYEGQARLNLQNELKTL